MYGLEKRRIYQKNAHEMSRQKVQEPEAGRHCQSDTRAPQPSDRTIFYISRGSVVDVDDEYGHELRCQDRRGGDDPRAGSRGR